ncbi:hypothetical protein ACSFA0_14170 [Variovorax sp. LT1P1]
MSTTSAFFCKPALKSWAALEAMKASDRPASARTRSRSISLRPQVIATDASTTSAPKTTVNCILRLKGGRGKRNIMGRS